MRRLQRALLPAPQQTYLASRTSAILESDDAQSFAKSAWTNKSRAHFAVIRVLLEEMAAGRSNCMYCDDNAGTDIDHFTPRSHDSSRTFDWHNYLLACSHCNSNAKRDQYPLDPHGEPLLLNPCIENPNDHLTLHPATGKYLTDSAKGLTSIAVYALNRDKLKQGRIDTWTVVAALIEKYVALLGEGRERAAQLTLKTLHRQPFGEVLSAMKVSAQAQSSQLGDRLETAFLAHPEI